MWLTVALSLFFASPVVSPVVSPLDDEAVAMADPSGVVRVSFDGGDRWIAVAHCGVAPRLSWHDLDLLVGCDEGNLLDGAELRAHWRMLAASGAAAEAPVSLVASEGRRRRAALRAWLPTIEIALRRDWSSGARSGNDARAAQTAMVVLVRWRLGPAAFGVR